MAGSQKRVRFFEANRGLVLGVTASWLLIE
jgi:hypothetical protein